MIDIYIVGTGIVGSRQVTREAEMAFEESVSVFLIDPQVDIMTRYMSKFDVEINDLTDLYEEQVIRDNIYEQMADQVLEAAETTDKPVTLALYGHPFVFVSPSRIVVNEAQKRGLTVEKRPGVSSMDCIYSDLPLDPAQNGIQMYEATDLLLFEYRLEPHTPTMIWQVGTVETRLYSKKQSSPGRFSRLRNYLEQFYPSNHKLYLLQAATLPFAESTRISFELGNFEEVYDQISPLQTLYIPAVKNKPIQNPELLEQLETTEHLEVITEDSDG